MTSDRKDRTYIAIDLKSYYASVECVERGLDPMTTDLVVADPERTKGTICLAVSVIFMFLTTMMELTKAS